MKIQQKSRILNNLHQSLYENTQRIILLSLLLLGGAATAASPETTAASASRSGIFSGISRYNGGIGISQRHLQRHLQ
ncbi:hypothetical protein QQF64_008106 [Cirrhinus molitorella]|uniref:Uncharacterized protein n=2 Tax=Cirrhinus molitorella TaxID=172907 RepID=A0AA88PH23_9TELE|nr:hypothetical protein Q8A67_018942 [Cirrhinus molitorella]